MQKLFDTHVLAKPPENLKVDGGHRTVFADAETEILKAYIGLQGVHGVHIRRQTLGLWVLDSHIGVLILYLNHMVKGLLMARS